MTAGARRSIRNVSWTGSYSGTCSVSVYPGSWDANADVANVLDSIVKPGARRTARRSAISCNTLCICMVLLSSFLCLQHVHADSLSRC
jgi:hypothetical protein